MKKLIVLLIDEKADTGHLFDDFPENTIITSELIPEKHLTRSDLLDNFGRLSKGLGRAIARGIMEKKKGNLSEH